MTEDPTLEPPLVSPDGSDTPAPPLPNTRWPDESAHPHRPRLGRQSHRASEPHTLDARLQDSERYHTERPQDLTEPISSVASSSRHSHPKPSSWRMRVLPDALDCLREHPRFEIQQAHERMREKSRFYDSASTEEILLSHNVVEEDREPLYHLELLRMFKQRLRIVAILGILLLPLFHFFYGYLSPLTAQQALLPHGLMLTTCIAYWFLAPHTSNLVGARFLTVSGYSLICTGASVMMAMLSQHPSDDAAAQSIQFVILAAHSQILLSVVLLPLSLWESIVMASIVISSLVWSAWWVMPTESAPARSAQIFVLATTAIFVLCVAHFQSILRRRAFDSAFDLARSASQLQALSTLDAVTGGFNRLYLEKTLSVEINRAARFHHPISVMMFDLDNFKNVNDTQGHPAGDEVLRLIWQAATEAVRDVDTVARYGGDEFMVVLPETETADARTIAERLQSAAHENLVEHFGEDCPESQVTLSIGLVTVFPDEPIPVEQVVALADERLYEAKRRGKNRIAV